MNCVDPDEMACQEPSHQDLHCLPFCFDFKQKPHFASVDLSKSRMGESVRNSGMKGVRAVMLTQLAFYVNLHRAIISPSATLTVDDGPI